MKEATATSERQRAGSGCWGWVIRVVQRSEFLMAPVVFCVCVCVLRGVFLTRCCLGFSVLLKSGFAPVRMPGDDGAMFTMSNHFFLQFFPVFNVKTGGSLCCGLAFSSRGMIAAGDELLNKLIAAIEGVGAYD